MGWDKMFFVSRQRKVIYGKGEEDILGKEKVILLAGEVVHGSGESDQMGQEKMIFFGQEKMFRWVRRV